LSKSPEDVFVVEFSDPEIGGAAECDGTCMAKGFPKPVRTFYRGSGTRAANRFTSDNAIICVIERQRHELGYLGHAKPPFGEISDGVFAGNSLSLMANDRLSP
jgi:hypothetical protein